MAESRAREGRFEMRVDPVWLKKLDALRKDWPEDDLPTRTDAVRQIVEQLYEERIARRQHAAA